MKPDYLVLENLRKSYDGVVNAVSGVSLSIAEGEFVSFLGPSGSGKTTTLMLIAGFEHADGGTIRLNGGLLSDLPAAKRNIGIVFQNYALFPHMTVGRNVEFSLKMRGMRRQEREKKARAALERVGLGKFEKRRPRELSGGQQQRTALARALVFEPNILLLDEPLGALDKNLREQMQIEIKTIQRDFGITTIYVTHDQSEAMTLSDRIVVFSHGVIEQCAPPLEIYNRPRTRFVAEFVGDCNFLKARVIDAAKGKFELPGIGTSTLSADATRRLVEIAPAGEVTLALRPELVRLAAPGETCPLTAEITIEGVVNYGSSAVLLAKLGDRPFSVRALSKVANGLEAGARIRIAFDAEDLWALP